jgi:hypothetical protein
MISTIAGDGSPGFSGDGGPAISARVGNVVALAVDSHDNLVSATMMAGYERSPAARSPPSPATDLRVLPAMVDRRPPQASNYRWGLRLTAQTISILRSSGESEKFRQA